MTTQKGFFTKKYYIECACMSKEHMIVLEYDSDMGMMVFVQMKQWRGFFKRCLEALRYVFNTNGAAGGWGSWDTCMITPQDIEKVQEWLENAKTFGPGHDYGPVKVKNNGK